MRFFRESQTNQKRTLIATGRTGGASECALTGGLQVKTGAGMVSDCVSDHKKATGFIVSLPPNENLVVGCYKLVASGKLDGDKSSPRYALFDIDRGSPNFWGKQMIFLGEYANKERISKEVEEIHKAISQGIPTYMLQYRTKTKWHWVSVEIVEE